MNQKVETTCLCGNKRMLWKGVQNPPCPICKCQLEIAENVKSGAIGSVTQWNDCKRIKRNIEHFMGVWYYRRHLKRVCLWCGVTLSNKRGHAKTCSGRCRKAVSRSGVNVDRIVCYRPERSGRWPS